MSDFTPVSSPDPEPPALPPPSLPFRRPADYYSSPAGEARAIFPKWVPFGCGAAAIVVLLIVFGAGVFLARGGMGQAFDFMFATMQGEIDKIFTKDVKPADKTAFDAEMKAMRESVRENRISVDRLQPVLRSMRDAVLDERVTPAETQQLTQEIRELNRTARK